MATLSRLPSVVIESLNEDGPALPANEPKRHWGRRLWRGFWKLISNVCLYWSLLSHIPLDIYVSAVLTNGAGPKESEDDLLDLHSTLPLLIVSTKSSSAVRFYNIETGELIWTFRIIMPKDIRNGRAIVKSSITCLKFSKGNHLAVGLSDGTVRFIEYNFVAMVESPPTPETAEQPKSERIKLLPLGGSRVNADFLGGVTNLVFSPNMGGMPGDDIWLAITTERAGIWIWSQRTQEAIRSANTAGINEGCLHWISVMEGQKPMSVRRKRRPISKWRRWSSFFDGVDDTSEMDRYFAPSPGQAHFPIDIKLSGPTNAYDAQPINTSIGVFGGLSTQPADENTHLGRSFLVFGTKNGTLQIQRLWHSSSMMVRETSIELSLTAIAQPHRRLTHRFGPAGGEITYLVMQFPDITTSEAKLTMFLTSEKDAESSIPVHQFSVSLPFKEPLETWRDWAPALAVGILRPLVNNFLAVTDYRWLSRRTWPAEGKHLLVHNDEPVPSNPPNSAWQERTLASASTLPTTPLLLTTTQVERPRHFNSKIQDECILRSHDPFIPSFTEKIIIKPLLPLPDDFPSRPRTSTPPQAPTQGHNYFAAKMVEAGITGPTELTSEPRGPRLHGGYATHPYDCGPVAWGQQKRGEAVGGFLYRPASLRNASLAVGLFKVQY
ncbi:hypothetical protein MMC07_002859 [Pseudocyphellaria aurata]|nr:hypothetical protein [Pseudocyphellaria aurata]